MNFKSYKVLFALVAIVFSLASCKKKEEPKPSIVGFWKTERERYNQFILEFSADGYKYEHKLNEDGNTYSKDTSNILYKIEGDEIILTSDGKSGSNPYRLEGDQLTIPIIFYNPDLHKDDTYDVIYKRVSAPTFK